MSLRLCDGTRVDWIDARWESGFSNFLHVDQHYGAHPVMRRLFSLARKHGYQSVLVEELSATNCGELASENDALAKRQTDFTGSNVRRLSFFKCLPETTPAPTDFIGSAVFWTSNFSGLPRPRQHVYEAIIPPVRRPSENNFVHCTKIYNFHTSIGDFSAKGVLYAQQNDLTTVCAHVALRTVLSAFLLSGDVTYAQINQFAGVDHQNVQVGGTRGLGPAQMEQVFAGFGVTYEKFVHEPNNGHLLPTDYQRHLYGCIESGAPALLGFELDDPGAIPGLPGNAGRHIIPVLGHTFNEDAWVPEAQRSYFGNNLSYYPSESWLSTFVAHDDNFGPYYCLPRNFLRKENFRLILAPKRPGISFGSLEAETLAFGYARALANILGASKRSDWLDRFDVTSLFRAGY